MGSLTSKNALVTGSTSGIGLAIARAFAAEGANVTINGLGDADAIERERAGIEADFGVKCRYSNANMMNGPEVTAMVHEAEQAFGSLDILVNNAGIQHVAPIEEFPDDKWEAIIRINLLAAFYAIKAALPGMKARKWGRIINTASIAGKEGNPNASAYSAAKGGVIALTKSLGKELAQDGISVNCITPAVIQTDILDQCSQEHIDYMLNKIPMGRFGEVDEAAAMVAWLASEECSFTTGGVFDLSGGRATY